MTATATGPRIRPGARTDVGALNWAFARVSGLVTGTTPPNLFLVLGRHRRLFRGWLRFAGRLMPGGTLPRRETELVILRVAHRTGCAYEMEHHRPLAVRAGVSTAELERITEETHGTEWTPRERVILATVDELLAHHDLADETWTEVREHVDERTAIELLLLTTHYEMLATTINTLRIPLDRPTRRG